MECSQGNKQKFNNSITSYQRCTETGKSRSVPSPIYPTSSFTFSRGAVLLSLVKCMYLQQRGRSSLSIQKKSSSAGTCVLSRVYLLSQTSACSAKRRTGQAYHTIPDQLYVERIAQQIAQKQRSWPQVQELGSAFRACLLLHRPAQCLFPVVAVADSLLISICDDNY